MNNSFPSYEMPTVDIYGQPNYGPGLKKRGLYEGFPDIFLHNSKKDREVSKKFLQYQEDYKNKPGNVDKVRGCFGEAQDCQEHYIDDLRKYGFNNINGFRNLVYNMTNGLNPEIIQKYDKFSGEPGNRRQNKQIDTWDLPELVKDNPDLASIKTFNIGDPKGKKEFDEYKQAMDYVLYNTGVNPYTGSSTDPRHTSFIAGFDENTGADRIYDHKGLASHDERNKIWKKVNDDLYADSRNLQAFVIRRTEYENLPLKYQELLDVKERYSKPKEVPEQYQNIKHRKSRKAIDNFYKTNEIQRIADYYGIEDGVMDDLAGLTAAIGLKETQGGTSKKYALERGLPGTLAKQTWKWLNATSEKDREKFKQLPADYQIEMEAFADMLRQDPNFDPTSRESKKLINRTFRELKKEYKNSGEYKKFKSMSKPSEGPFKIKQTAAYTREHKGVEAKDLRESQFANLEHFGIPAFSKYNKGYNAAVDILSENYKRHASQNKNFSIDDVKKMATLNYNSSEKLKNPEFVQNYILNADKSGLTDEYLKTIDILQSNLLAGKKGRALYDGTNVNTVKKLLERALNKIQGGSDD